MQASSKFGSANLLGVRRPPFVSGQALFPPHMLPNGATTALTASVQYCAWFWIDKIEAWSGAKAMGVGTSDSGKKLKIAAYDDTFARVKDFGEQTMGSATAIYAFASSWTPAKVGWHQLRLTSDSNPTMANMYGRQTVTSAGVVAMAPQFALMPLWITDPTTSNITVPPGMDSVSGTYANFPESTALTATAAPAASPAIFLYK